MNTNAPLSRRQVLLATGAVASASLLAAPAVLSQPVTKKKIVFAWSQAAFCHSAIPVAQEHGFFDKNGLDVELLNWAGSADTILEALSTDKAQAGAGLIHRWIKPLEAGFDVKLISAIHGGCLRLLGVKAAGVTTDLNTLKGKTIGVADLNSPGKQFFAIHLAKHGIDIDRDVQWRVYPADLLDVAAKKGEIQAIADGDPGLFLFEKRNPGVFTEIGNSAKGEYADKLCCVIGAGNKFIKKDRDVAAAIVRSLVQAADFVAENPNEGAKVFNKYTPKFSVEDLTPLIGSLTYHHHPTGKGLTAEVENFARDFRDAGILKKSTDPARFASAVTQDVLG
jgi:NitT/TauT family transport system substrate-binding protein